MDIRLEVISKLARWNNTLNNWKWPHDMPFKPVDFDELPGWVNSANGMVDRTVRSKFTVMLFPLWLIKRLISEKECLRWHHVNNLGRTDPQFERWWAERGETVFG